MVGMLVPTDFKPTEQFKKWLRENRTRPLFSQCIEDSFCISSKASEKSLGQDRCEDNEYATLIKAPLLSGRHKFVPIDHETRPAVRSPWVPPEVYKMGPAKAKSQLDFEGIMGAKKSTKFASFSADSMTRPILQMDMAAWCCSVESISRK